MLEIALTILLVCVGVAVLIWAVTGFPKLGK